MKPDIPTIDFLRLAISKASPIPLLRSKASLPICGAILALTAWNSAQAAPLVYDGFETPGEYEENMTINAINGGTGWTGAWNVGSGEVHAVENSIPVTGLVSTAGKIVTNPEGNTATSFRRTFDSTSFSNLGDEVWFAYAYNRDSGSNNHNFYIAGAGSTTRFFGLRSENSPSGEVNAALRFAGSTVEKSATSIALVNNTNYFIIGRMTFDYSETVFARLDVWVDPSDFSSVLALGSPNMFVETSNEYTAGFEDVWLASGANASYQFDEIRIGGLLGDVAPVPEPSTATLILGVAGMFALVFRRRGIKG